jgi:hypothetical protein
LRWGIYTGSQCDEVFEQLMTPAHLTQYGREFTRVAEFMHPGLYSQPRAA